MAVHLELRVSDEHFNLLREWANQELQGGDPPYRSGVQIMGEVLLARAITERQRVVDEKSPPVREEVHHLSAVVAEAQEKAERLQERLLAMKQRLAAQSAAAMVGEYEEDTDD